MEARSANAEPRVDSDEESLDVRVANLDCESNAARIDRALKQRRGVKSVTVYSRAARGAVRFRPEEVCPDALREQLRDLGFPPVVSTTIPSTPRPSASSC